MKISMVALATRIGAHLPKIPPYALPSCWLAATAQTLFLLFFVSLNTTQASEPKRTPILLEIDVCGRGLRPTDARTALREGLPGRGSIFSRHRDRLNFPYPAPQSQKKVWTQKKHVNFTLDLVKEVGVVPEIFPSWIVPASPPGSVLFLNIQPTIWESYRWYIAGIALFSLTGMLLILALLRQWKKNREFQQAFADQMAFEKMLAELSTTFINLPEHRIGPTIEESFDRIAKLLNLDRITLFEYSPTNAELKVASWCGGEVSTLPAVVKAEKLPWWTSLLLRGEPIFVSDVETLPEEAASELEHLRRLGTISLAMFPLRAGDKFFGSISFGSTKRRVFWTEVLVERLRLLAEIFSNALIRKRVQQLLRESDERFRLAANTAPVSMWMSGTDKRRTFFNQGWRNFTGRTMEQELGDGWVSGVHPDDLEKCVAIFSASFDARIDFEMEYRLRRFDGVYRWVLDLGAPRYEPDRTFCGYIGSCVDITERKLSEESLRMLTGRLIRAQEEERARIARDLHDDFSQRLALLSIGLGQLWKKVPESDGEERAMILEMLKKTKEMSSDIHSLSHQLHSSKLEHVGLGPALRGLCKEVNEKFKIEVRFIERKAHSRIPKDVALCLFRVAQEALGNIVKHSNSKDAQVELGTNADGVSLCISDAGRGFDPGQQNSEAGIGLVGMSERLRLVGGTLSVRSEPDRGTDIFAEVPLAPSAQETRVRIQSAGR
jgi:PAS domain S-box-containing protein